MSDQETVARIFKAARQMSGKDISLCLLKEEKQPEENPMLYFVVTSEKPIPLGGLILELKIALHCQNISVVHKSWGPYRELTEVSVENLKNIEPFLT